MSNREARDLMIRHSDAINANDFYSQRDYKGAIDYAKAFIPFKWWMGRGKEIGLGEQARRDEHEELRCDYCNLEGNTAREFPDVLWHECGEQGSI